MGMSDSFLRRDGRIEKEVRISHSSRRVFDTRCSSVHLFSCSISSDIESCKRRVRVFHHMMIHLLFSFLSPN